MPARRSRSRSGRASARVFLHLDDGLRLLEPGPQTLVLLSQTGQFGRLRIGSAAAFLARQAAPLVLGHAVDHPETVATAIRIGRPARGEQALEAAEQSGGRIVAASDEEILAAQKQLASEGLWVEPASAAGLAGLRNEVAAGSLDLSGKTVVCVCTGHGLKDPAVIMDRFPAPRVIEPEIGALAELIE